MKDNSSEQERISEEFKCKNGFTRTYNLIMYAVHSGLENSRNELTVTSETTVDNFQQQGDNYKICQREF